MFAGIVLAVPSHSRWDYGPGLIGFWIMLGFGYVGFAQYLPRMYVAMIVVLAGVPTSFGASTYYYQQQSTTLNNHVSSLTTQLNTTNNDLAGLKTQLSSANSQVSSLNNQIISLNGQLSQLQSQNSQLQGQVNLLQSQLTGHNQLQVSTVSQGQVSLSSNNGFQQVGFSVPPNAVERLNITFSTASQGCLGALPISAPCSLGVSLFNQTQFAKFSKCNCIQYGNYTTTTWGILNSHDTSQRERLPNGAAQFDNSGDAGQ